MFAEEAQEKAIGRRKGSSLGQEQQTAVAFNLRETLMSRTACRLTFGAA
jgi:hypothetical protein